MRKEEKNIIIDSLTESLEGYSHFYLTDTSELNAADTSDLRRKCFEKEVKLVVVKNTLLKKALEKAEGEFDELYPILRNSTSVMFCNTGNAAAKLIKDFRKKHDKPLLKGAFVEESVYLGDNQLEALVAIKSKEELIGDIVLLLQSPLKNVVSQLQSGGNIIHGVLETLSEKEEK